MRPFAVPKISCSLIAHEILTAAHAYAPLHLPPAARGNAALQIRTRCGGEVGGRRRVAQIFWRGCEYDSRKEGDTGASGDRGDGSDRMQSTENTADSLRLRSRLIAVQYDMEQFGMTAVTPAVESVDQFPQTEKKMVVLTIPEPLPARKELTSNVEEH